MIFVDFLVAVSEESCKKENIVPLQHTIFSDHLTPVLAYRCLVKEDDRESPSFLFESVEPGDHVSTVVRNFHFVTMLLNTIFSQIKVMNFNHF